MSHLLDRVRRYAAQQSLWSADTRVVAAVSGGADSVALFCLLQQLAARGDCQLAGLAHLHHHIRGDAADGDAAFCRELAARAGVPAVMGEANVPELARAAGVSLEVAGRDARQRFYAEAQVTLGASRVAVAHTRDDQAETVMLRLVRGAGALGLSGMAPCRGHLVRPLLDVPRAELRSYLNELGVAWREDATNDDRAIPRNWVRHEVLPRLRELNAQADAALARAAGTLRTDAVFLDGLANEAAARLVRLEEGALGASGASSAKGAGRRVTLDAAGLAQLPVALATRVALRALETANPSRSYGLEEAQLLCETAAGGAGGSLAGLAMERFDDTVVLTNRKVPRVPKVPKVPGVLDTDRFELQLDIPGAVDAPHGRWTLSAAGPMPREAVAPVEAGQVMVDASTLSPVLIVRPRRPGDRLHPLGAPGRKKVQDVFVDRKIPRDDRDREPIVTDEMGRIVWVAGQVLAAPFRVTPLTTTVVVLTLRRQ
jgi:tRNA(Ile)-lysidine synthase